MISIIIPCHSTLERAPVVGQQLWYTVASAISALEGTGQEFEIMAIMNGEYPMAASMMHEAGSVRAIFCGPQINSPQSARHYGFQIAKGDVLFSLDAHVLVAPNFFRQILSDMRETGADFMGAAHRFLSPNFYAHTVDWEGYLWGHETITVPPRGDKPFQAAQHPHGAFAITANAYREIGGYWLAMKGFGGEESQLCFKLWLMGKTVWVTPRTNHWHWLPPGDRRGVNIFEEVNFVRNFMLLPAAYADEARVRKSHAAMMSTFWGNINKYPMVVQDALADPEVAKERAFVAEHGKYKNLAELREMWNATGVLN